MSMAFSPVGSNVLSVSNDLAVYIMNDCIIGCVFSIDAGNKELATQVKKDLIAKFSNKYENLSLDVENSIIYLRSQLVHIQIIDPMEENVNRVADFADNFTRNAKDELQLQMALKNKINHGRRTITIKIVDRVLLNYFAKRKQKQRLMKFDF